MAHKKDPRMPLIIAVTVLPSQAENHFVDSFEEEPMWVNMVDAQAQAFINRMKH